MPDWLTENSEIISVLLNMAMLVVWIIYLQLFFVSYRRSSRAVIHIDRAVGEDKDARCLVANMGADTVYVLGIKVALVCEGGTRESMVTDWLEEDDPDRHFSDRTCQGPLAGGEVRDIGSFEKICRRASRNRNEDIRLEACEAVEITVVVAAQQAHRLMGGYKRFDVTRENGRLVFRSPEVLTRQIGSWRRRRSLAREIGR